MYGLWNGKTWTPSSEIIAKLDRSIPLQLAHIRSIEVLEANGMRYSNEDCDVLGAAAASVGKTEVPSYQRAWVERMTGEKMRVAA